MFKMFVKLVFAKCFHINHVCREINYTEAIAKQGCSQVEELDFVIALQRIKLLLCNDKPMYFFFIGL